MNENLYVQFSERFPDDRSRAFIETGEGVVYSYADLEDESARIANYLTGLGLRKGDRVAVQVDKVPFAVFLYLACLRAGLVFLPLNTAYKRHEIEYFLGDAEPAAIVVRAESLDMIRELAASHGIAHVETLLQEDAGTLVERSRGQSTAFEPVACSGDDLAAILYTSGTTGRPKGAMISHRNLASNARALHEYWGWTPDDVLLHALPIFHVHGLFVALNCVLMNGSGMLFLPRFDVDAILASLPRATVLMGVPTFYTRLLGEPTFDADTCRNMRLFISGSAPLLVETFREFQARTGHTILERYGMTETGMNTSNPLVGERRPGTVGFPLPGVTARVVGDEGAVLATGGVGVLQVKGDNVFRGYWRMPEKTAEEFTDDGYFITGDISTIDERGYVSIVGRAKDLVISGGYNVYPKEIELCIDDLDGVLESAVIGVPDADFGEAVTAVVVRRPGDERATESGIIAHLKETLAGYKVPRRVHFLDALPRNTMGKVQKNVLRDEYGS